MFSWEYQMNFSHIFLFHVFNCKTFQNVYNFHLCVVSPTMVVRGNPYQSANELNIFDFFLLKEIHENVFENEF
jgi:hypothetical protein